MPDCKKEGARRARGKRGGRGAVVGQSQYMKPDPNRSNSPRSPRPLRDLRATALIPDCQQVKMPPAPETKNPTKGRVYRNKQSNRRDLIKKLILTKE